MDRLAAAGETLAMPIHCRAQRSLPAAPAAVFALMVDPDRFPALFVGCGPIPAIRRIELEGPLAVGARRRIHNSDGSVLDERVTMLEAPFRHGYTLSGFRAPFSWLVGRGDADWRVEAGPEGSRLCWDYTFVLASAWAWPAAALLLHVFMARAMRRCLDNMARALAVAGADGQDSG